MVVPAKSTGVSQPSCVASPSTTDSVTAPPISATPPSAARSRASREVRCGASACAAGRPSALGSSASAGSTARSSQSRSGIDPAGPAKVEVRTVSSAGSVTGAASAPATGLWLTGGTCVRPLAAWVVPAQSPLGTVPRARLNIVPMPPPTSAAVNGASAET